MKHKGVFSFVLIICMFSFSLNSYAEQVNWRGDDVKTLVDIYNSIDVNSPEEWERFEDEYAVSGERASFFFHNSELRDFKNSNKLIKITYNQVGEPTEETNEYYERMKTDFGFYFMTDDYKEYYYGFDITKRAVFTIKDAIKGSGVSPDHISVAILLGNPYNEPFEVSTVDVIDYVKGWNRIDGKKYYIKNDGTMAIGLYKIKGVMYYFGKDGICNGKYTGFAKNSKGKLYYKNGVKVTKNTTIDGVRYKFSSDGCCKGYFTGFTRSSQGRKYWSNGILAKDKWVQDSKGNYYYAGNDGYLLTGWQKVTRIGGNYSYFYENGIWDGKVYHKRYIQNNLRAVFKDMDFFGGNKFFWSYNNHSDSNMKPFIDIDVVYSIVEKDLDKTLLWDEEVSYDEIDTAPIYHGGKKIIIRSSIRKSIDLEFTKDKKGNSYLYNSYFGFGLELTDSDAYDKIKS